MFESGNSLFSIRRMHRAFLSRLSYGWHGLAMAVIVGLAGMAGAGADPLPLTLTPAAAATGWKVSTFCYGWTGTGAGPLGIGFTDSGSVIVSGEGGAVRVFPTDTDNQDATKLTQTTAYGSANAKDIARIGTNFYMTQGAAGKVVQINPDGTPKQTIVGGLDYPLGIVANPANGHLLVASFGGRITDVDPVAKKATLFIALPAGRPDGDGLTTDGTTLYVASDGFVFGYRLSDKKLVFNSGYILGADGCAIGTGSLTGSLFVNTNYGQVFQIDLATQVITLIATGGSRGDFVTVDPNGTLLLTQSTGIARLAPPPGESFLTAKVTAQPSTVAGGLNAVGTIALGLPAPNSVEVNLLSTNAAIHVPASVTVPAGSLTTTFPITTSSVSASTTGKITVALNGVDYGTTLTVRPVGPRSLVFNPNPVKGSVPVTGTVTLEGPAPAGGVTVALTSDNSAILAPGVVTVTAGTTSATFTVAVGKVSKTTTVTVTATANGISVTTKLVITP